MAQRQPCGKVYSVHRQMLTGLRQQFSKILVFIKYNFEIDRGKVKEFNSVLFIWPSITT